MNAMEKLMKGYEKEEKKILEEGTQNEAEKEGDVTNYEGEKQTIELTAIDKLMKGYAPEEAQKDGE